MSLDLIDSVELERMVANLNKELAASHETEGALRAQLEEQASFQTLPEKVDSLMKQVGLLSNPMGMASDPEKRYSITIK